MLRCEISFQENRTTICTMTALLQFFSEQAVSDGFWRVVVHVVLATAVLVDLVEGNERRIATVHDAHVLELKYTKTSAFPYKYVALIILPHEWETMIMQFCEIQKSQLR